MEPTSTSRYDKEKGRYRPTARRMTSVQILVNTLRAEPELRLSHDHCGQGFTLTLSPGAIADVSAPI